MVSLHTVKEHEPAITDRVPKAIDSDKNGEIKSSTILHSAYVLNLFPVSYATIISLYEARNNVPHIVLPFLKYKFHDLMSRSL